MCFGLLRILIPLSVGSPLVKLNSIDYSRDIILLIIQEIVVNFRVFQTFHMGLDIPVFAYASCVPGRIFTHYSLPYHHHHHHY